MALLDMEEASELVVSRLGSRACCVEAAGLKLSFLGDDLPPCIEAERGGRSWAGSSLATLCDCVRLADCRARRSSAADSAALACLEP